MLLKNQIQQGVSDAVRMFASYAHEDRAYVDRLRAHLTLLIREGIVSFWTDQAIAAGDDWRQKIQESLQSANVILFLVSADFLASDFIWYEEMKSALARHQAGQALVVPILVRHVEWQTAPFAFIQMLPEGCLPISAWPDPEQAFADVARKIRDLIKNLDRSTSASLQGDTKGSAFRVASDTLSRRDDFCRSESLLFPSKPFQPPTMKGVLFPRRGIQGSRHFIFNWGDLPEGTRDEPERERLFRYFRTCLSVEDRDQWVNLSAYESNRMIPDELIGTLMGHDMLQFDCDLKRLSATMLHPEFETGANYWKALHERLAAEFLGLPVIHSFKKVTLLPSDALIYTSEEGREPHAVLSPFLKRSGVNDSKEYVLASVLKNELSLLCSEDEEALGHDVAAGLEIDREIATKVNRVAVQTFKEIVIPVMENEIRFGSSFARVRQIYSAMLLATWLKREHTAGRIDMPSSDVTTHFGFNIPNYKTGRFNDEAYSFEGKAITGPDPIIDSRDFYKEYLELLRCGIYQSTRRQYDPSSGGFVTRVYSSGAFSHYGADRQPVLDLKRTHALAHTQAISD